MTDRPDRHTLVTFQSVQQPARAGSSLARSLPFGSVLTTADHSFHGSYSATMDASKHVRVDRFPNAPFQR